MLRVSVKVRASVRVKIKVRVSSSIYPIAGPHIRSAGPHLTHGPIFAVSHYTLQRKRLPNAAVIKCCSFL